MSAADAAGELKRQSLREALAVYLKRRVLIVLLLGFSSGLPIVLIGSTLQAWMTQSGIDVRTIGLFAAVGIPYSIKFLWAPFADALDIPVLSPLLGRRRGWLLFTQIWLMVAIVLLGLTDPSVSSLIVAIGALFVATASATQDIVIDAFRVESLEKNEQAAGLASYIAAYRIGALTSGAGALLLVTWLRSVCRCARGMERVLRRDGGPHPDRHRGDLAGARAGTPKPAAAEADHAAKRGTTIGSRARSARRSTAFAISCRATLPSRFWASSILFKTADALAFSLSTNFILGLGFSLPEIATIRNGIGFVATLLGGFAGGFIARALPLSKSLWIGGLLQTLMILCFSWQAHVGMSTTMLTLTTTIEFFTDAVGTVIFVAYMSVLCKNPLYTATQFALAERARRARANLFLARQRLCRAHHRLGVVFHHLRARRLARPCACSPGCKSAAISTDYRRQSPDL